MRKVKDDIIEKLRKEINTVDKQIVNLLNARAKLVIDISEQKSRIGILAHDPSREKDIIKNLCLKNTDSLNQKELIKFYQSLFEVSRRAGNGSELDDNHLHPGKTQTKCQDQLRSQ